MQLHESKNAQYFNLLCLTSTQGSNNFCMSNLTPKFLLYIMVLLSALFGKFLLLQEHLKKLKTPQPTLFILQGLKRKWVITIIRPVRKKGT